MPGTDAWLEQTLPAGQTLDEWRKTVTESSAGECDVRTLRRCSPEETQFITRYGTIMTKMDEDEFPEKMKGIFAALAKQPPTPHLKARIAILKSLEATVVEARATQKEFFDKANRVAALAKTGATQAEIEEAAGFKQELNAMKFREAAVKEMEKQKQDSKAAKASQEETAKAAREAAHAAAAAKEKKKEEL